MADRLRGEADEELTALRKAHEDVERELAAAQQRQKAADTQLVSLRGELKESRQRLASLNQAQGNTVNQPRHERETSNSTGAKDAPQRGTDGGVPKSEQEAVEKSNESDVTKKNGTSCRGVAIRYLRNVTNEDRNEEEARPNEARRVVTTERSRCDRPANHVSLFGCKYSLEMLEKSLKYLDFCATRDTIFFFFFFTYFADIFYLTAHNRKITNRWSPVSVSDAKITN